MAGNTEKRVAAKHVASVNASREAWSNVDWKRENMYIDFGHGRFHNYFRIHYGIIGAF